MGLLDQIHALQQPQNKPCKVSKMLAGMDKQTATELATALADPSIGNTLLSRVLKQNGYEVSKTTIALHREKGCACVFE